MKANLEIAVFSLSAALQAAACSIQRLEFCSDYEKGGLSPSFEDFASLKKSSSIPVYIMLRNRADFSCNAADFKHLLYEMKEFKALGADGFVFGFLSDDGTLNEKFNRGLLEEAALPCTLHRCIDQTLNPLGALEVAESWGFEQVLSSGGEANALLGMKNLEKWRQYTKMTIIAGGGIRSSNLFELKQNTNLAWFHSAALTGHDFEPDQNEINKMLQVLSA